MQERSSLGRCLAASLLAHLLLALLTPSLGQPGVAVKASLPKPDLITVELTEVGAGQSVAPTPPAPVQPLRSKAQPARPEPEEIKLAVPNLSRNPAPLSGDEPREAAPITAAAVSPEAATTSAAALASTVPAASVAPLAPVTPAASVPTANPVAPTPQMAFQPVQPPAASGVSRDNLISAPSSRTSAVSWAVPVVPSPSDNGARAAASPSAGPAIAATGEGYKDTQVPVPVQIQAQPKTHAQTPARPETVAQASLAPAQVATASSAPAQSARLVTHRESPLYPVEARRKGWEGRVRLEVLIAASGKVTKAKVIESSGYPSLDQAARKAAAKWRFTPAPVQPQASTGSTPPESETRFVNIVFELK